MASTESGETLRIPDTERGGALAFLALSGEQLDALAKGLEGAKPALSIPELARRVAVPKEAIAPTKLIQVLRFLVGVCVAKQHFATDTAGFVPILVAALNELVPGDCVATNEHAAALERLLALEASLVVTAKALSVMTRHPKTFHAAQVLTDIRSIFGNEPLAPPQAAVVIHNLRIVHHAHDGHGPQQFALSTQYFALDRNDVESLIVVLQRALQKEEAIRQVIGKNLDLLEVPKDNV